MKTQAFARSSALSAIPNGSPARQGTGAIHRPVRTSLKPSGLLTKEAMSAAADGAIPDPYPLVSALYRSTLYQKGPITALPFVPIMRQMNTFETGNTMDWFRARKSSLVLVKNELIKATLIYWEPGKASSIHGHPKGGCVFRILRGNLREKRYAPHSDPELLAVSTYRPGSLAYIDDEMAFHAVENPFPSAALSLHVYTPGM